MAYTIKTYNNTPISTVQDGTVDTTLDIKLIGKNFAGYGEAQNENFVYLLENFAGPKAPPRMISGQIWYDSSARKLKFYDGQTIRATGGATVVNSGPGYNEVKPTNLSEGDIVWDKYTQQMWAFVSNSPTPNNPYVLIGPQKTSGSQTEMRTMTVADTTTGHHDVIVGFIANSAEFVISNSTFVIANSELGSSFSSIVPGINYKNSGAGGSAANFIGISSNSLLLNGKADTAFIQKVGAEFDSGVVFSDDGLVVGKLLTNKLKLSLTASAEPGNTNGTKIPTITSTGNIIYFKTTFGQPSTETVAIKIVDKNIMPSSPQASNIGASGNEFGAVFATTFNGTATKSDGLKVTLANGSTAYFEASVANTASRVAVRDENNTIFAGTFNGTATKAFYADLAEKYLADADYEVGTVVIVGGEKEVTACTFGKRALGTVSENPAYMMNSGLEGGTYIALKGRVPVKVTGSVKKGDRLVAGNNGTAIAAQQGIDTFAIALEDNDDIGVKIVEAVIL